MNEFKMSLFLAPISPVKDGGTGQIIKPATLKPYKTMTLQEVYRTITANTRLQLLTDRVRRAFDSGDLSAYRALKQELLPYVTPCGTFARRRSDSLLEASGLVVVDIDHLDSADEAARLRRQLFEDPFLRPELVFISPCGQGVKASCPTPPTPPCRMCAKMPPKVSDGPWTTCSACMPTATATPPKAWILPARTSCGPAF